MTKKTFSKTVNMLICIIIALTLMMPCLVWAADVSVIVNPVSVYAGDDVTVSGTGDPEIWVTIKVLEANGSIVYLNSILSHSDGSYSDTFKIPDVSPGELQVVVGYGSNTAIASITVTGRGGGGQSTYAPTPTYKAVISRAGTPENTLPVNVNANAGIAVVDMGTLADNVFDAKVTTVVTVPSVPEVNAYTLGIPAAILSTSRGKGALTFSTDTGSFTIPYNMLSGISAAEGKKAGITIEQGNKSYLSDEVKAAIGDRPLIQLILTLNGKQTEWSNPDAPVTISIPYTPTAAELANSESIVIWYIDGNGKMVCVPNGHYDLLTGTVSFTTTHFSYYAVGYNKISFNDVAAGVWYNKVVGFIAARDITTGTGNGNYSPEAKLTRGEFLVLLMKAYDIASDEKPKDNFSDAGSTYYTDYLAAAKRLGISSGVGNNRFAPEKEISRQEMFTLLYNALKVIGRLPQNSSGKSLSNFTDAGQIESWAKDAMTLLVETGTIGGSGGKLTPADTTTRAEIAQVLYNLLSE